MKLKFKNILMISLLAVASVFGAFSAVVASQKSGDNQVMEEARADSEGDILAGYALSGNGTGAGWTDTPGDNYKFRKYSDGTYRWNGTLYGDNGNKRFRVIQGGGSWTTKFNWNKVNTSTIPDNKFTNSGDGDGNILCNFDGEYSVSIIINSAKNQISFSTSVTRWYYMGSNTERNVSSFNWGAGNAVLNIGDSPIVWAFQNSESFKFLASPNNWGSYALNPYHLTGTAAASCFGTDSDSNIVCQKPGRYKISVKTSATTAYTVIIDRLGFDDNVTIYRFTRPNGEASWTNDIRVYPWGSSNTVNNPAWADSYYLLDYSFNENSERVYYFLSDVDDYKYFIFRSTAQTSNIEIGDHEAWYWDGTKTGGNYNVSHFEPANKSLYFYDYANVYNSTVKCRAFVSNGYDSDGITKHYTNLTMTPVLYGSGQVYWCEFDQMYDYVIITNSNGSITTGEKSFHDNWGKAYSRWGENDFSWVTFDKAMAHDWVNNTMHLRDVSTDDNRYTGACYGTNGTDGYYGQATNDYNHFSNDIRTLIAAEDNYSYAYTRLQAWAKACGSSATITESEGNYTLSSIKNISPVSVFNMDEDNWSLIVIIVASSIALLSVTALSILVIRKRKSKEIE